VTPTDDEIPPLAQAERGARQTGATPVTDPAGAAEEAPPPGPLIELGWVLAGGLSAAEREAVLAARELLGKRLEGWFPQFRWLMPVVVQPTARREAVEEPFSRLHEGVQERDARAWDFALVVTPQDLRSYYKSYALAVPSRALAVAVLSLARLVPDASDAPDALARRVAALALHLFGDLNGLWHRDEPMAAMRPPQAVGDLDAERSFEDDELEALAAALHDVADLRLEETARPPSSLGFYLRASRERAAEIGSAVLQAKPWEFPLRLSRLTAAAFSALFILLVTAEVWDLGTSQRPATIVGLSLLVIGGTTGFTLTHQKLILRRTRVRVSEQSVVTHVSATLIVLLGMATTYALLFLLTVGLGLTLFGPSLIGRWAPAAAGDATFGPLLVMAGLVSSLGLLIGSLGASFEGQHYFRHIIYADEET